MTMMNNKEKEARCCGDCCWFAYEDIDGFGCCMMAPINACERNCGDDCCEEYISKAEKRHLIAVLQHHNLWRRDGNVPNARRMDSPEEIGKAIDFAVKYIKIMGQ